MHDICEALRQRLDALESQNQKLDAFARALAHQLKAPLFNIAGYTGYLYDAHSALSTSKLRENLERVHVQAQKAIALLDELQLWVDAQPEGLLLHWNEGEQALEGQVLARALCVGEPTPS
jgi:light-regulated signal transduction histidine kinase (bacteriophytochrome)